jgi:DNA mismatch repair protein MutS2
MSKSSEPNEVLKRTLNLLEWPELCERLSGFAVSQKGADLCRTLLPERSDALARRQLSLTSEMANLLCLGANPPLEPFSDLIPLFEKAERGERLPAEDLHQIGAFLSILHRTRMFFEKCSERIPALSEMASCLQALVTLREAILEAVDSDGQIKETASPRLVELKEQARRSKKAIVERLEDFLKDPEGARMLQDTYYTIREGRFVLPVRMDAGGFDDGIVHDVSASGATRFVEPQWLVGLNNALRVAEIEIRKEVERILADLTHKVAVEVEALRLDMELMSRLDLVHAKAKLSQRIMASEPKPSRSGDLVVRGLQHPLLTLRKVSVVPNDLLLGPDERILLISGPNAGGKTVLLKALGLAVLMERAGLHIPANPGSRMPAFEDIFADIGDQQDIQQDISTFSGHMRHMRQILELANERSLVILDELAGSTDPQEGTSLALAILEALYEKGTRVLVTTHYPALKVWAQGHSHVRNGAMEFNWARMEPTYRLHLGIPGQSSALEVARRIGLPETLLERAKINLQGEETDLEGLLRELQQQRSALEEERRMASLLTTRLQETLTDQEELNRSLRDARADFLSDKKRRLSSEIKDARQRIRAAMKAFLRTQGPTALETARSTIRDIEAGLRPPPITPKRPVHPLGMACPGDLVEILPLGQQGVLLDDPHKKRGRLRVKVGSMEVQVDPDALGGVENKREIGEDDSLSPIIRTPASPDIPAKIDLRGMTVEDALDAVERYIDQSLLSQTEEVRVIHGHGTGALKQAVRKWLSFCGLIEGYRPGDRFEGGDGATIVRLRSREDNN